MQYSTGHSSAKSFYAKSATSNRIALYHLALAAENQTIVIYTRKTKQPSFYFSAYFVQISPS